MAQLFGVRQVGALVRSIGVDESVQCLARSNGKIAVVIGANPRQSSVPQIWLDQDTFQVIRMVLLSDKSLYDFTLEQWDNPVTNGSFPNRIRLRRDRRRLREFKVSTLVTGQNP